RQPLFQPCAVQRGTFRWPGQREQEILPWARREQLELGPPERCEVDRKHEAGISWRVLQRFQPRPVLWQQQCGRKLQFRPQRVWRSIFSREWLAHRTTRSEILLLSSISIAYCSSP